MLQNQIIEFAWKTIKCWEVDETNGIFSFQFQREEKGPKCVKLHTPYVSTVNIVFVKLKRTSQICFKINDLTNIFYLTV